jgi:stage II sporulation protein M
LIRFRWWILASVCLFGIGLGIGLALPAGAEGLLSEELAALGELGSLFGPYQITTAIFILFKNLSTLAFTFMLSPILCLVPIFALIFNGMLLSLVATLVLQQESLGFVLGGLLPHGIIEVPALIISQAAALSFGTSLILAMFKKEYRKDLPAGIKRDLKYLALAAILMLPAAFIETYLTPMFLD